MPLTDQDILPGFSPEKDPSISPLVPQVSIVQPSNEYVENNTNNLTPSEKANFILAKNRGPYDAYMPKTPAPIIPASEIAANSRYDHYFPGENNEELAAMNQRWYSQLANGVVKFGATAGGTFLSSVLSFPRLISAAKSGDLTKAFTSPLEVSIDNWLENLEDIFPNYYTQYEQNHPLLSMFTPTGAANALSDKVLKNLGFTVGAIGGALVQDAILTAITGGIGTVANLPVQLAKFGLRAEKYASRVGKFSNDLNKIFATAKNAENALEEARTAINVGRNFSNLRNIASRAASIRKFTNSAQYTASLLGSARAEAAFEARQGYNMLKGDLIQEYKDTHAGADPDAATLSDIEKQATAAANTRFIVNMALLTLSNSIQFDNVFNLFRSERRGLSDLLNIGVGSNKKIGLVENSLDEFEVKGSQGFLKSMVTGIISEGFLEEGLQGVTQEGTYNFYHDSYYDENKNTWNDVLSSTAHGFGKTFGTEEGWEQVVVGGLISLISGPVSRRLSRNKDNRIANVTASVLNRNTLTGIFEDKYKHGAKALSIAKAQRESIRENNIFKYKNLKHDAFYNFIMSALSVGRFDVRIQQLEMLKDLSDEEFAKVLKATPDEINRNEVQSYVNNLIEKARDIKTNYENLKRIHANPYKHYEKANLTDDQIRENAKHIDWNNWLESVVWYASMEEDALDRVQSIANRWNSLKGAGYQNLTPEIATKARTQEGLIDILEKYKDSELGKELSEMLSELTKGTDTFLSNDGIREKYYKWYAKYLNAETGSTSFKVGNAPIVMREADDIIELQNRALQAEQAYDNLTTDKGRKDFMDSLEKDKRNSNPPNSKPKKETITTKRAGNDHETEIEEGKTYFLFSADETPEGAQARRTPNKVTITKITDGEVHYSQGSTRLFSKKNFFNSQEVYTEEELTSTEKGKYFLKNYNQAYRVTLRFKLPKDAENWAETTSKGPVGHSGEIRGGLEYIPGNEGREEQLYFVYADKDGYHRLPIGSLSQLQVKGEGEGMLYSSLHPDGALRSSFELGKEAEKRLKTQLKGDVEFVRKTTEELILKQKEELESLDKEIDSAQKSIKKIEEKIQKRLSKPVEERRVTSLETEIKEISKLNQIKSDLVDHIEVLNRQRNDLAYSLDYLSEVLPAMNEQYGDTLPNVIGELEQSISDINQLIKAKSNKISRFQGLIKAANAAIKSARKLINDLFRNFKINHPDFRTDQINAILNGNPLDNRILSPSLAREVDEVAKTIDNRRWATQRNEKALNTYHSNIKSLISEIENLNKEKKALTDHLTAIYHRLDEKLAEEERLEALRRDHALQQRLFGLSKSLGAGVTVIPNQRSLQDPRTETDKKEDAVVFSSTTNNQDQKILTPDQIAYNVLLNHLPHLKPATRKKVKIIFVTKNNEDSFGLTGFTQPKWEEAQAKFRGTFGEAEIDDVDKGLINAVFVLEGKNGEIQFIDRFGNVTKDQSEIVYSTMPSTSTDFLQMGSRFRTDEKETPAELKARVQPYVDSWRETRRGILAETDDSGNRYTFTLSRGKPVAQAKGKKIQNNVVESGLVKQTKDDNYELDKKTMLQVSRRGTVTLDGQEISMPVGAVVLVNEGTAQIVHNRNFSEKEADNIIVLLQELVRRFYGSDLESSKRSFDKSILNYLQGVLHFGTPDKDIAPGRNQMWVEGGMLHMGKEDVQVPFTEKGLLSNKDHNTGNTYSQPILKYFLGNAENPVFKDAVYNSVNAYTLENEKGTFEEITGIGEDGELQIREWKNYQNFLLSPTYQLYDKNDPLHGKKRDGLPYLTTHIKKIEDSKTDFPYEGRYAVLSGLPEVKIEETPPTPPPPPTGSNGETEINGIKYNNAQINTLKVTRKKKGTDEDITFNVQYTAGLSDEDGVTLYSPLVDEEGSPTEGALWLANSDVEVNEQQLLGNIAMQLIQQGKIENVGTTEEPFLRPITKSEPVQNNSNLFDGKPKTITIKRPHGTYNVEYSAEINAEGLVDFTVNIGTGDEPTQGGLLLINANAVDPEVKMIPRTLGLTIGNELVEKGILKKVQTDEGPAFKPVNTKSTPTPAPTPTPTESEPVEETNVTAADIEAMLSAPIEDDDVAYQTVVDQIEQDEKITAEEKTEFIKWMKANLPQFSVNLDIEQLIEKDGGGYAWGRLKGKYIDVFRDAPKGTPYHEAFEAVWNYFLNSDQQQELIKEARKRKGSFFDALTASDVKYSEATDDQIKENLADQFWDYKQAVNSKQKIPSSIGGKIRKFFRFLMEWLRKINPFTSKINKIYSKIDSGAYAKLGIKDFDKTSYKTIPELSITENRAIVEDVVISAMNKIFTNVNEDTNEEINSSSLFNQSAFSADEIFSDAYRKLTNHINRSAQKVNEKYGNEGVAHDKIVHFARILKLVDKHWYDIKNEARQVLQVFGVNYNDNGDLEVNDENRTMKDYSKDFLTMDPIKSSSVVIKILLATLSQRSHGKKGEKQVFGEPLLKPSVIGGGKLTDFGRNFIQLMEKLHGTNELDEMINSLVEYGKVNPDMISLFKRLGGKLDGKINYSNLDYNQWRLLINFFSTFSKQKPVAMFMFDRGNGIVYSTPAAGNDLVKSLQKSWLERLKSNAGEQGSYLYKDKADYKVKSTNLPSQSWTVKHPVEFLEKLGAIEFKQDVFENLEAKDKVTVRNAVGDILKALNSAASNNKALITPKGLDIEGAFNKIARIYINETNPEPNSIFLDEKGKFRQHYIPQNRLSIFTSKYNKLEDEHDLAYYFPHVNADVFSQNSLLRVDEGREKELQTGYMLATINPESGFQWNNTRLTGKQRLQAEINMNLNGWYYAINSVDSNTEHMIYFGEFVPARVNPNDVGAGVRDAFEGYLKDEINLILDAENREANSAQLRSAKGTDRGADKLRFMQEFLSEPVQKKVYKFVSTSPSQDEIDTFIRENSDIIKRDVSKELFRRVEEQKDILIKQGSIEKNDNGTYDWLGLDKEAPGIFSNENITEEKLQSILLYTVSNQTIANIEMHKWMYGDPFQLSEKDSIRRKKLYNSANISLLNSSHYNDNANIIRNRVTINNEQVDLEDDELGRVNYKKYVETATVADIKTQSQVRHYTYTNEPSDELKKQLKDLFNEDWDNIEVTDGSAMGSFAFFKQFMEKSGEWSDAHDDLYHKDMAIMRYELSKEGAYEYKNKALKAEDKKYYDQFVKNGERHISEATLSVKKPVVTGPKNNVKHIDTVQDKYSVVPITWSLARQYPDIKKLYQQMMLRGNNQYIDYVIFESGRKTGANFINNLYDEKGNFDETPLTSDIQVNYDTLGIISQVDYKEKSKITQGTQITNLATVDLFANGYPQFDGVKEKVDRYNGALNKKVDLAFNRLLKRWKVEKDGVQYVMNDKSAIAKIIQHEVFRRLLPKNVIDALQVKPDANGDYQFVIPPEATNVYAQINNVIMSEINKAFSSPKVNGTAAVQVSSGLFSDGIRYENGKLVSDTLKFYKPEIGEDGEIKEVSRCEVMISSKALRKRLPKSFDEFSDDKLLKELRKNKEVLQGVAFRIPTSGINLTESFVIKKFLPEEYGDTVVVPAEITLKTGSDFDIDKLNMYFNNLYVDEKGDVKVIPPTFKDREEAAELFGPLFDHNLKEKKKKLEGKANALSFKQKLIDAGRFGLDDAFVDKHADLLDTLVENADTDEDIADIANELMIELEKLDKPLSDLNDEDMQAIARENYIDKMYEKSIENKYFDSLNDLILDPHNFFNLLTPNDTNDLTELRDKLLKAKGLDKVRPSLTDRSYLYKYRLYNMVGKINVGQYSLSQIYHAALQQVGGYFDPNLATGYPKFIKDILRKGSALTTNRLIDDGGEHISFSGVYFSNKSEGKKITEILNQAVGGAVDMTKDQFLAQLGFVEQRGPVSMAMIRAGVDPETVVWFINQPIIQEYVDFLNSKGTKNLLIPSNIEEIKSRFKVKGGETTDFNIDHFEDNIKKYSEGKSLTNREKMEQQAVLDEFLFWAAISKDLLKVQMGLNYDRFRLSDPSLMVDKNIATTRAKQSTITGARGILRNTFVGKIQDYLNEMREVLGTFLIFEKREVRKILDPVMAKFSSENMFLSEDDKKKIAGRIKSEFINYLLQVSPVSQLNNNIVDDLVTQGETIADRYTRFAKETQFRFSDIGDAVSELTISTRNPGKVRNLAFPKKAVDPNSFNNITDKFREFASRVELVDYLSMEELVKLAILQSGIDNSPISFTAMLPVEDYAKVVKPVLENLDGLDLVKFDDPFFRNNWKSSSITPTVKAVTKGSYPFTVTFPYDNIPADLKKSIKHKYPDFTGRLIGLRSDYDRASTDYHQVKIISVKDEYRTKQGQEEIKQMAKRNDWSYLETTVYQKVYDSEGAPFVLPAKDKQRRIIDGVFTYVYRPVYAWGDGFHAKEHYTTVMKSQLDNDTAGIGVELTNSQIIEAANVKPDNPTPPIQPTPVKTPASLNTGEIKTYTGKITSLREFNSIINQAGGTLTIELDPNAEFLKNLNFTPTKQRAVYSKLKDISELKITDQSGKGILTKENQEKLKELIPLERELRELNIRVSGEATRTVEDVKRFVQLQRQLITSVKNILDDQFNINLPVVSSISSSTGSDIPNFKDPTSTQLKLIDKFVRSGNKKEFITPAGRNNIKIKRTGYKVDIPGFPDANFMITKTVSDGHGGSMEGNIWYLVDIESGKNIGSGAYRISDVFEDAKNQINTILNKINAGGAVNEKKILKRVGLYIENSEDEEDGTDQMCDAPF